MAFRTISAAASRLRVLMTQWMARLGLRTDSFLLILAVIVGMVTAAAAVGFHELTVLIRDLLYERFGEARLYGPWVFMLVLWPALGGLAVGVISNVIIRAREGHGIVDVIESVIRSSGFIRPTAAVEKIVTSAITIGTGGSAGAEGPIVQIGAAIASGVGSLFRVARGQMPTLIGCGAAAGISAIFNSPMGGMLFALEVILQDFSIRSVTPVVVASVIANVATKWIFSRFFHSDWHAIFRMPPTSFATNWAMVGNSVILGVLCGLVGVALTRLMYSAEARFANFVKSRTLRPAIGGAILGLMGIVYVLVFGWLLFKQHKPIPFHDYPMPAFYGDGYGFIQLLLAGDFYDPARQGKLFLLLLFLITAKLIGTTVTLGSGGSGGVIAPALFLGAVTGGVMGLAMRMGMNYDPATVHPELYAILGMGAVLAAVVHAPMASIVILLELTGNSTLVLPAMLSSVIATGVARVTLRDSIYTLALRRRGLRIGGATESSLLHRLTVEQVELQPTTPLKLDEPFQRILELMRASGATDFAVLDKKGLYCGMVLIEDIREALVEREAIPLLTVEELVRSDIPMVTTADDLSKTMEVFAAHEVGHLPVCFPGTPGRVIGLISRSGLMLRYQQGLAGAA
jgi:CIC family chloride channel protein